MNTKIRYMYTDGSNYKQRYEAVVKGAATKEQVNAIYDSLDPEEFFVAEQVGLPAEGIKGYPVNEDDRAWYQMFTEDGIEETKEEATIDMTIEELARKFVQAKNKWDDVTYAPMCDDEDEEEDEE